MVKTIEISRQQVQELLDRLEHRKITEDDYDKIKSLILTVASVNEELSKKIISIKRLRKLFAIRSEKSKDILPPADKDKNKELSSAGKKPDCEPEEKPRKKPKGHGRNGKDAYENAETVLVSHATCKRGDSCPECEKGKLYPLGECGVFVHIIADAPFKATKYELEKLRCSLCGLTFTAAPPEHTNNLKYDESTAAMIAILKYGSGFPFYRIDTLQSNLGVPLPSSTQWEIIEDTFAVVIPVHTALINAAAQGKVIHNDDTKMKVLSLIKENKQNPNRKRKGIFTSGFISRTDNHDIALYFTGRNTAGENLQELLQHRDSDREAPIQMCDASSSNVQTDFDVILANCLTHGRRKFVDLIEVFQQECIAYPQAIKLFAEGKLFIRDNKVKTKE